jgi:hypothetical protein
MTFEMIKKNFTRGLWNRAMVIKAVEKAVITPDQFEDITGTPLTTAELEQIATNIASIPTLLELQQVIDAMLNGGV